MPGTVDSSQSFLRLSRLILNLSLLAALVAWFIPHHQAPKSNYSYSTGVETYGPSYESGSSSYESYDSSYTHTGWSTPSKY